MVEINRYFSVLADTGSLTSNIYSAAVLGNIELRLEQISLISHPISKAESKISPARF